MHEAAMVASLMRILEEEAARHGVERITKVGLAVGLFTSVEPNTLRACFELYAENTVAEGAELRIETVPARGKCLDCQQSFPMTSPRLPCPHCGGMRLEGSGGREFAVTGIEAERLQTRNMP